MSREIRAKEISGLYKRATFAIHTRMVEIDESLDLYTLKIIELRRSGKGEELIKFLESRCMPDLRSEHQRLTTALVELDTMNGEAGMLIEELGDFPIGGGLEVQQPSA